MYIPMYFHLDFDSEGDSLKGWCVVIRVKTSEKKDDFLKIISGLPDRFTAILIIRYLNGGKIEEHQWEEISGYLS